MGTTQPDCELLLVENNASDIALVRQALFEHRVCCTLHIANDGAQAITFLDNLDNHTSDRRLDLVLLEMHLPKHGGVEILRRLRSMERCAQTPVIVMTASFSVTDQMTAEKYAAQHFFEKPSTPAEFMEIGEIVLSILNKSSRAVPPAEGFLPARGRAR